MEAAVLTYVIAAALLVFYAAAGLAIAVAAVYTYFKAREVLDGRIRSRPSR